MKELLLRQSRINLETGRVKYLVGFTLIAMFVAMHIQQVSYTNIGLAMATAGTTIQVMAGLYTKSLLKWLPVLFVWYAVLYGGAAYLLQV